MKTRGCSLMVEQSLIQEKDKGSSPIQPLQFFKCGLKDVSGFIKQYHYSHSHPGGVDFAFKVTMNDVLVGACIFGYMAGNIKASCVLRGIEDAKYYRELMRLVLLDQIEKNSESKFVGWCLRWLKKETSLKAIISFADPHYGHIGTVYQASNWLYTGLQKSPRPRIFIADRELHPKSCYNLYGTSSIKLLENLGLQVSTSCREPKHRYVYVFDKTLQNRLKYEVVPYVKKTQP